MFKFTIIALLALIHLSLHAATNPKGTISLQSSYSVKQTADRFEDLLAEKGLSLFARIDHKANAESVNMELRSSEVIIFGNPKLGTPLMQCEQSVGLDLPQKLLVWEDRKGDVWITYNSPSYLQKRHKVKACSEVLAKISKALDGLAKAVVSKQ